MDKIRKLRDKGITVLIVKHDMKAVMGNCEKKLAEGTPEEIRHNQAVIEAYLGEEEAYA